MVTRILNESRAKEEKMLGILRDALEYHNMGDQSIKMALFNPMYFGDEHFGEIDLPDGARRSYFGLSFYRMREPQDEDYRSGTDSISGIVMDYFGIGLIQGTSKGKKLQFERRNITDKGLSDLTIKYDLRWTESNNLMGTIDGIPGSQIVLGEASGLMRRDQLKSGRIRRCLLDYYKVHTKTHDMLMLMDMHIHARKAEEGYACIINGGQFNG